MSHTSQQKRIIRHRRIRAKISGTSECPRLAVYRSNMYIYAQLIDDIAGITLAQSSDRAIKEGTKSDKARSVGSDLAQKAIKSGITACVFDRGGFLYTGRIAALADAARASGLNF